ncbi:MAG TPA: hypothetical protein VJT49_10570 [Amycolatopsis sp.]|uniref:hypothetical protein n=1 Tax=Amycolatopsis sp. TaxID=37632 RepID=UPI002B4665C9|nr:hypothetical protein [Amycolatopsis sp.]HKS45538.1 hypothetical protein [Amycolatopsis sp.]
MTDPHQEMPRAVLAAVEAAQAALTAIDTALATGQRLGVATFGFAELMACRHPLATLTHEHGRAVSLSRNEIAAEGGKP